MEINYLKTFLQVAFTKNFTKTGKILGYSQSSISAQIQQLEKEVGVKLFDRIGKKVALTQHGEEMLPYAQQIISTYTQIENFMRSESIMNGTIHLGMVESLFEIFFEKIFFKYHQRFPKVKIELNVDATFELLDQLRQNKLDIACLIGDILPPKEWISWYSKEVEILIIANPNSEINSKKILKLQDLASEEFILMEDTASYSVNFQNEMLKQKVKVNSFIRMQNAGMARNLVAHANYLAVLPKYTVQKAIEENLVKELSVSNFTQTQYVQIILHKNKSISPQLKGILEEITKIFSVKL